jgi:NAD(P)-dependent dehydrogenase (short-subunit alcohol dehydrogenase family)
MTTNSARLAGRVAVVTGAATGIGEAIARLYAEEGASVVLGDIRPEIGEAVAQSIRDDGGQAIFVRTDVAESNDLQALVASTVKSFGGLDIMTANAGILGRNPWTPLHQTRDEDVRHVMDINFFGVANAFKFAIPVMLKAGGGALTATTSLSAHRAVRGLDGYSASKAAITGLVRSMTAEYSPAIRVNAVSPGAVATELATHTAELNGGQLRWPERGHVPVATGRDIAYAHLFLVSDEARMIAGQILRVDGGRSVLDVA